MHNSRRSPIRHESDATVIVSYCSLRPSYRYPVIVFVEEGDLDNDVGRRTIRSFTGQDELSQSRLFIQVVRFRIPDFVTGRVRPLAGNGKTVGYRHMCRFHARTVYEEPTIGFKYADGRPVIEYAWRLDDDSFLYRPIKYDPFAFMRDRQLLYGYIQVQTFSMVACRCSMVGQLIVFHVSTFNMLKRGGFAFSLRSVFF